MDQGRRKGREKPCDCVNAALWKRSFRNTARERTSVGNIRSGSEDENEAAGSNGEGEKAKVRGEALNCQREPRLSEEPS